VRTHYPNPERNAFRQMLFENEHFLAKLARLPKTISHGDTYPTNLMSRTLSNGQEQTIALDWALMSIEPLGDDLGQFLFGAQNNLKDASRADVEKALFESYLEGLLEGGYRCDPRMVRFGYTTLAALRVGLFALFLLGDRLKQNETEGEKEATVEPFEVRMAEEAYELLGQV
jgi:hypothetical protein